MKNVGCNSLQKNNIFLGKNHSFTVFVLLQSINEDFEVQDVFFFYFFNVICILMIGGWGMFFY